MGKITILTKKVLNYTDIPEKLTDGHWLTEYQPDCYVMYNLKEDYTADKLDNWIARTYPELIEVKFLIYMNY